jgi:hypothetical protein
VDAGTIIAICVSGISIAIALGSLVVSIRADRRAGRAEKAGQQANPIVTSAGASGPSGGEMDYHFTVFNDGPATITRVEIWIADHEGQPISTGDNRPSVLTAKESVILTVKLVNPERKDRIVWVRWRDPTGEHEKPNPDVYVQP